MVKTLIRKNEIKKELARTVKIFGKNITVKVIYSKIKMTELELTGNIINVYLPNKYKNMENTSIIKLAIDKMYDEIARIEIESVMEETRIKLNGLAPEDYKIEKIKNKLAKTLSNKTIIVNPEIVKYDKKVLKYVILHEFCKLKYKSNSKAFKKMMEENMENYDLFDYIADVA